jgi:hypothetical protein
MGMKSWRIACAANRPNSGTSSVSRLRRSDVRCAEARGLRQPIGQGLCFDGTRSLDDMLGVLDTLGPEVHWSRDVGTSLVIIVAGSLDGRHLRIRLIDREEIGGRAARVTVDAGMDLEPVVERVSERLGALRVPEPELTAPREAWLRAALTRGPSLEARICEGLAHPSGTIRRCALEASWLAATPRTVEATRERAQVEDDESLRRLFDTTVALLRPTTGTTGALKDALRKADDIRNAKRRLEGLEELAALARPTSAAERTRWTETLGTIHRGADDRDARFIAGVLAMLA